MLVIDLVFIEVFQKIIIILKSFLKFEEKEKVFDPNKVYGDAPNPTKL